MYMIKYFVDGKQVSYKEYVKAPFDDMVLRNDKVLTECRNRE